MRNRKNTLHLAAIASSWLLMTPTAHAGMFDLFSTGGDKSTSAIGKPATIVGAAPSASGTTNDNCDENARKQREAREKMDSALRDKAKDKTKKQPTCLDKYTKFNMNGALGLPTKEQLYQQLLGQVCSAADQQTQPITGAVNQGLPLPGGVGRINTNGAFGTDGVNGTNTANINIGAGGVQNTGGTGYNPGGGGYSLPPLWR